MGNRERPATAKVAVPAWLGLACGAMPPSAVPRRQTSAETGFSLIELLVVLAILGLLIGLVAPPVLHYLGRAKTDVAKVDIHNLESSLELYRLDFGRYPTQS